MASRSTELEWEEFFVIGTGEYNRNRGVRITEPAVVRSGSVLILRASLYWDRGRLARFR